MGLGDEVKRGRVDTNIVAMSLLLISSLLHASDIYMPKRQCYSVRLLSDIPSRIGVTTGSDIVAKAKS